MPPESDPSNQPVEIKAPASAAGKRLDAVAAVLFSDYSRSRLQSWIKSGYITVDGQTRRVNDKLVGGEDIVLNLPPDATFESFDESWENAGSTMLAEPVPIEFVHTDEQFYIVNKQEAMVMHPAPGNRAGTLMNGLLHLEPTLRAVPRAGIVHRLDKDTTGLCVVARTLKAHTHLVDQLQQRSVSRRYLAIVLGTPPENGTIEEPIGRHPKDRKRMAVVAKGKPSRTHYKVLEQFNGCALVEVKLDTGRTHQIRVHMTHIGFPLLGDPIYRKRGTATAASFALNTVITAFKRQALHAWRLGLKHPVDGSHCEYKADPPEDFQLMLAHLRNKLPLASDDELSDQMLYVYDDDDQEHDDE